MKLVFIAGMEHSGTTLTDYLLSGHPSAIGVGEASSFFSPTHMAAWVRRWPGTKYLCSCGMDWADCPFWGPLRHLCGLESDAPLVDKYRALLDHARRMAGDDVVVVDSSKSTPALELLLANREDFGLGAQDLKVVFAVKDVRSFTCSIAAKRGAASGLLAKARTFNWWLKANARTLQRLQDGSLDWRLSLYERLCADPDGFLTDCFDWLGLSQPPSGSERLGQTHIAFGNKDFSLSEDKRVRYDGRWLNDGAIKSLYLVHWRARQLNLRLYDIADRQAARS